jgi:hypothetical protein
MRYSRKEIKRRVKKANKLVDRLVATRENGSALRGKNRKNRKRWKREMLRLVYPLMQRGLW